MSKNEIKEGKVKKGGINYTYQIKNRPPDPKPINRNNYNMDYINRPEVQEVLNTHRSECGATRVEFHYEYMLGKPTPWAIKFNCVRCRHSFIAVLKDDKDEIQD